MNEGCFKPASSCGKCPYFGNVIQSLQNGKALSYAGQG